MYTSIVPIIQMIKPIATGEMFIFFTMILSSRNLGVLLDDWAQALVELDLLIQ